MPVKEKKKGPTKVRRALNFLFCRKERPTRSGSITSQYLVRDDSLRSVKRTPRPQGVRFVNLFRYASKADYMLFVCGLVLAFLNGLGPAAYAIVVGEIVNYFILVPINSSEFHFVVIWLIVMLTIGIIMTVFSFFQFLCFKTAAARIVRNIRCAYLKSLLRQDLEFFAHRHAELRNNIENIQDTIGEKIGNLIRIFVTFIAGIAVSFYFLWELAAILSVLVPFVIIWSELISQPTDSAGDKEAKASSGAKLMSEEALSAIRTVQAFNAQSYEINRYSKQLKEASKHAVNKSFWSGIQTSIIQFSLYIYLFVGTIYGAWLYQEEVLMEPGNIFIVLASIAAATFPIATFRKQLSSVLSARVAAAMVYDTIDFTPDIDTGSQGKVLRDVNGEIEFFDVSFRLLEITDAYLNRVTFKIASRETVAIIGIDRSLPDLITDLLSRFYDVSNGQIKIDSTNVRFLNISFLRSIVGTVEQDPEFFNATIESNVRIGNPTLSFEDVVEVCQEAGIHDFIQTLAKGYKTLIDDDSEFLTMEHRQKLALARVLARRPKILVLNESTRLINKVQNIKSTFLGTIIIATSRAQYAKEADRILVISQGKLEEEGTYESLLEKQGLFAEIYAQQKEDLPSGIPEELYVEQFDIPEPTALKKTLLLLNTLRKEFSHTEKFKSPYSQSEEQDVRDSKAMAYNLVDLIKYAIAYRKSYCIAFVCCFLSSFGVPMYTKCNGDYFAIYETDRSKNPNYVHMAIEVAIYYLILGVVCNVSLGIYIRLFGEIGENLSTTLRTNLYSVLLHQDGYFYDEPGRTQTRIKDLLTKDAPNCRAAMDLRLGQFLTSIMMLVIAYATSVQKNIMMGALASLCFVIQPVLQFIIARLEQRIRRTVSEHDQTDEVAMEAIERIKTVHHLNCQDIFIDRFEAATLRQLNTDIKVLLIQSLTYASINGLPQITTAVAYILGYFTIHARFVKAPLIIHRITQTLLPSAANAPFIPAFLPEIAKCRVAASHVIPLMKQQDIVEKKISEGEKPEIKGEIEFKNVDFAYLQDSNKHILKDLSFKIEAGQNAAIIAPIGSGKRTVFALMERFYNPTSGKVLIDGNDITTLCTSYLRSNMCVIGRDSAIFSGTVKDNIIYGLDPKEINMSAISFASKTAGAAGFIAQLPQGYDTQVGTRGSRLTAGQRHRIALARALIRNPKILLIDISHKDIDAFSEIAISDAVDRVRYGRTCIIASRKLPSAEKLDQIVTFENGRISEKEIPHISHRRSGAPTIKIKAVLWDPPSRLIGLI